MNFLSESMKTSLEDLICCDQSIVKIDIKQYSRGIHSRLCYLCSVLSHWLWYYISQRLYTKQGYFKQWWPIHVSKKRLKNIKRKRNLNLIVGECTKPQKYYKRRYDWKKYPLGNLWSKSNSSDNKMIRAPARSSHW